MGRMPFATTVNDRAAREMGRRASKPAAMAGLQDG